MFTTLLRKELAGILLSPKFPAVFGVCALLLVLSVGIGIHEYQVSVRQYETASQAVAQELREQTRWSALNNRTYRVPDPMQVFVAGVNNDIGRWSSVTESDPVKLRHSAYSDDTIYALFRFIDFSFIVQVVLSLFALLFTYDAVNGERERGTLALTFSHPVPRSTYLLAKITGGWLGLVLPLLVPVTIGILLVVLFRVPMEASHWFRLGGLLAVSLVYFTFFVVLGVLVSCLTRRSSISFLLGLVAWVLLILIIPRAGVLAAGEAVVVPTVAEVEAQQDAYSKDRWMEQRTKMEARFQERQKAVAGMSKEDREKYENDHMWSYMEADDAERRAMMKEIEAHGVRLQEDLRNRKALQERLALLLARFSPAASYQIAAMEIAGTGLALKSRYEDALLAYREAFTTFTQRKQKESGDPGGIRITMDSERGLSITSPRETGTIDLSEMPRFTPPAQAAAFPFVDITILLAAILASLIGAFAGFMRYDMRS